ncbi:MAG: alpha/beta hydrolase [Flavobacteriia bacterium]|jgi:pimeloyl-ACP methyl ester carboxylesterase
MKKIITLSVIALLITSACKKRLDDFLFNNDNTINEYLLDDYTGRTTLDVGNEYQIADSMIHIIEFPITSEGENLTISAIYVGDIEEIATDTVLLYCHGTADHNDFYWPRQKLYANLGTKHRFGVLMVDYPGYGLSDGNPTEQNMYDAVNGGLSWLKSNGLTNDRLVMFGFSLGSAAVCEVAGNPVKFTMQPFKIILEAPFASAEKMIQDASILAFPGSYFVNVKIDNAEEIKKVDVPMLWIHGKADAFLAIEKHGEIVYSNYVGPSKTAIRVPGGDHEDTPFIMGFTSYLSALLNFITQ